MSPIIQICNLSKTYVSRERRRLLGGAKREVHALKGITLDIEQGEIFGLLGPNGAGKTTLIRCLTTLLLPTSGTAMLNGCDVVKQENEVRASIGCMLMGERGLYWKLTGRENLDFFGALYHLTPAQRKARSNEIIALLHLSEIVDRTVETYSSGQKMKLAFGKALINDAPILILDEPTNTLDVPSARELRATVKRLNEQGKTIVYTTHVMSEAEELCDRVAIMDRGEIIALGTVNELKSQIAQEGVTTVEGVIPEAAVQASRALAGVREVAVSSENGKTKLVVVGENARVVLPALIKTLFDNGATIEYISPAEVTLEDVFVAKTGRTLAEDTSVQAAEPPKPPRRR
ncbi:MAG: ABC transporter ATP-binding protein [Chloroflexi bacterium]|nr:ABC transporter ATP-binding protein [Chloroflexota bacterium]